MTGLHAIDAALGLLRDGWPQALFLAVLLCGLYHLARALWR